MAAALGSVALEGPFDGGDRRAAGDDESTAQIAAAFASEACPNLVRFTAEHVMQPGYGFGDSFEYGFDLLLDGIADALEREGTGG